MYGYKTSYGTNLYSAYSKGKYSETILENMELDYYAPCPVKQCMNKTKNYRYVCNIVEDN